VREADLNAWVSLGREQALPKTLAVVVVIAVYYLAGIA
jgi:hypothetical protein